VIETVKNIFVRAPTPSAVKSNLKPSAVPLGACRRGEPPGDTAHNAFRGAFRKRDTHLCFRISEAIAAKSAAFSSHRRFGAQLTPFRCTFQASAALLR